VTWLGWGGACDVTTLKGGVKMTEKGSKLIIINKKIIFWL